MDALLRAELLRYGEMAQACYDAFDFDPFSKYCGSCKYTRRQDFLTRLGMADSGYDVSRYLYATSNINLPNFFKNSRWPKVWSTNANWIGYVAVSNDEKSKVLGRRDIVIAWRGTVTRLEWIADLMDFLRPISTDKIPCPDPTVKVESGFLDLYTDKKENCDFCKYSAREQVLAEVNRLIEMYPNEELSITITGHSLGSALALLSGYDIVETGINVLGDSRAIPVCVFSYSGPRVGNVRFKERAEGLGLKVLRIVNVHDMVPKSPGFIFNESMPQMLMKAAEGLPWSYSHVGVELALDHKNSPFLKPDGDLVCAHNLEAHLHLLDGYHGKGQRFVLASGRDPALVNKGCDFLKDHYMVPPNWMQDENKQRHGEKRGWGKTMNFRDLRMTATSQQQQGPSCNTEIVHWGCQKKFCRASYLLFSVNALRSPPAITHSSNFGMVTVPSLLNSDSLEVMVVLIRIVPVFGSVSIKLWHRGPPSLLHCCRSVAMPVLTRSESVIVYFVPYNMQ
ncbi:alpha/beta-Hydrolases superfamily protein [Actinidia rufa]|uniref:Alpha/beta-Hydrolases superfamily protein n=1 Tax=Actinidia rufa TaxID=165716 RepID=A0A7J0FKZ8_9ERIC|nr:alpha/beta-Hydrolases superfamily protein [Actinidia rufa]